MATGLRIKNWKRFQHFSDRRPVWIKLYRELLDDVEWHELSPAPAKLLMMLWLLASETDGYLPDIKTISFRLRMSCKAIEEAIPQLTHWVEVCDIGQISDGYQDDIPETEKRENKETETDVRFRQQEFEEWYVAYPRHVGKGAAREKYRVARKKGITHETLLAGAKAAAKKYANTEQRFIPMPTTWLNQERWDDEEPTKLGRVMSDEERNAYRGVR
jgi:hypothetical protein